MDYGKLINLLENDNNKVIPIIKSKEDIEKIKFSPVIMEYVFREKNSKDIILDMDKDKLSVGTVLSKEEAKFCIDNGINIMFSPHLDEDLVKYCIDNNGILIPGIFTATEIMKAYNIGVKVMKFFPCHSNDNIKMLKQYSDIFDKLGIKFIATGGIDNTNYKEVLSIKNVVAVGSSKIREII